MDAEDRRKHEASEEPVDAAACLPRIYDELRRLAARYVGKDAGTLQPTALVHEAFLKLANAGFRDLGHFRAVAATAMRQALVDHARGRSAAKRGGGAEPTLCDVAELQAPPTDVLVLDDALTELRRLDGRKADVVELRVFGGLTIDEAATHLRVSHMTVSNDWRFARAWLAKRFAEDLN
ncbi:MAG: ECF-type sigma factor [Planctomycetota bacterium]